MSGMGSSSNLYQQALSENKFLQMTILELKHKAALYEVCLGSISSIIKDLPTQQNINDTKKCQKMALHKISNVLSHVDCVVKTNTHRTNQTQMAPRNHVTLPQPQPTKVPYAWYTSPAANSSGQEHNSAFRNPSVGETPITIHKNPIHPIPQKGTEERLHRLSNGAFHVPVPTNSFQPLYPPSQSNLSTLSIHKCMRSPEPHYQSVGSMTVSPIKFPNITPPFATANHHSYPIAAVNSKTPSWSMFHQNNLQLLNLRKRRISQEIVAHEEISKKKSPSEMEMTRAENNIKEKPKISAQAQFDIVKQAVELANAKQIIDATEKNNTAELHNMEYQQRMTFHAEDNNSPSLQQQEKYSHHQHVLLSGGNLILNNQNDTNGFQPESNGSHYMHNIQIHTNDALEYNNASNPAIAATFNSMKGSGSITSGQAGPKEVPNGNGNTTTTDSITTKNNNTFAVPVQTAQQIPNPIKVYHLPKISINTGPKDTSNKPAIATPTASSSSSNAIQNQKEIDPDCFIINE